MTHSRLLYLGDLSGLDGEQQKAFLWRLERLVNGQITAISEDAEVERQALHFYGKYFEKHRLGEQKPRTTATEGGLLLQDREELINLKSFTPLEIRETGAEWLCWQALAHLGIMDFLSARIQWDEKDRELMLLNLMGRLLYPVSERKTGLWATEQSGILPMMKAVEKTEVHGHSLCGAALRWLSVKDELEDFLYGEIQESLGGGVREAALFDLTNVYFEGRMQGSTWCARASKVTRQTMNRDTSSNTTPAMDTATKYG